ILMFIQNNINLGIFSSQSVSSFGVFISSPIITLILTCIIFLGALYQLYSERINFSGIASFIFTLIFFIVFVIVYEISLMSVLLFAVGVILGVIELYVVGAVHGILRIIAIIGSFILVGDNLLIMGASIAVALIIKTIEWMILVQGFKRKI